MGHVVRVDPLAKAILPLAANPGSLRDRSSGARAPGEYRGSCDCLGGRWIPGVLTVVRTGSKENLSNAQPLLVDLQIRS